MSRREIVETLPRALPKGLVLVVYDVSVEGGPNFSISSTSCGAAVDRFLELAEVDPNDVVIRVTEANVVHI